MQEDYFGAIVYDFWPDRIIDKIFKYKVIIITFCVMSDGCKVFVTRTKEPFTKIVLCIFTAEHDFSKAARVTTRLYFVTVFFLIKFVAVSTAGTTILAFRFWRKIIIFYTHFADGRGHNQVGSMRFFSAVRTLTVFAN